MLEDSDGQGGLHLWILFAPAIDLETAYKFARWIRSDYPSLDIECNPKQRKGGQFGNGVRLPGKHHKRDHHSRFWGDAEWLSHAESIDLMLSVKRNSPAVLGLMRDFDPDPKPQPKAESRKPKAAMRKAGGAGLKTIEQTEQHIDQHFTWDELLRHYGWTGGPDHWTRPGKDHGTSATLNFKGSDMLHIFSEATELPADKSYSKWRFWCYCEGFQDRQADAAKKYREVVR